MLPIDLLLHFAPLYRTRPWGGRRLQTVLGRQLPDDQRYGESWDLVDREDDQSIVSSGPLAGTTLHDLWTRHRDDVFGRAYAGSTATRFPLLIKVLDCADDLSLQVHPPESVAAALHGEPKTEMWYVAHADEGARIYAGLRAGVTRDQFAQAVKDGTVAGCVHQVEARTGDSLFVPSGRVHALGRGLLIHEIQQNSDTTYRVFDWNRVGLDGAPRQLHVTESLQCIDFSDVEPALSSDRGVLASCEHFRVSRARTGYQAAPGTFRLIVPIAETTWAGQTLMPGEVTLSPASSNPPEPVGEWLEIELPIQSSRSRT